MAGQRTASARRRRDPQTAGLPAIISRRGPSRPSINHFRDINGLTPHSPDSSPPPSLPYLLFYSPGSAIGFVAIKCRDLLKACGRNPVILAEVGFVKWSVDGRIPPRSLLSSLPSKFAPFPGRMHESSGPGPVATPWPVCSVPCAPTSSRLRSPCHSCTPDPHRWKAAGFRKQPVRQI